MPAERDAAPEIDIQVATDEVPLPAGTNFREWIETTLALSAARCAGALTLRLVGEHEARHLNESFRHKEGATNVLAFPAPDPADLPPGLRPGLGDIVVCLPVVYREAGLQGRTPLAHLAHMVVHGTLHLLGYAHDCDADARHMEATETKILGALGFADPYDELEPGSRAAGAAP
jgi:probable rRNA maturation factor